MGRTKILFLLVIVVCTVSCASMAPSVAPGPGEEIASGLASPYIPLVSPGTLPYVESFGKTILVANQSGSSLVSLYFETTPFVEGEEATNLLGDLVLPSGAMVSLSVSDLPWIAEELVFDSYGRVYVTAFSSDGEEYSLIWYPTSDLWAIVLKSESQR